MNKVELLAPAGNFDCLKAAINNGANAVYLGGKNFSARAFANNFSEDELIEAVKYAHLRNVKVYVTLNTLLNENEFNNAIKMVDFYYKNNVDALLIQDLGLYYYIKNNYPDFELHCSTQMHIHNLEGVKTAKKLGFKRVVLARESSLDFIKEACKQDIEIETFVHGAICVSYSGQCLMSSVTKNRSANKGMCAQCCRFKYELCDEQNNLININTEYPISPKDMFLLEDIQTLIKCGVKSFKIEGRMKSSAYVGYVTKLYRKAIDNPQYKINENELNNIKVLFNRNFTNDYLNNKNNLFGQKTPNHLGIYIGNTVSYKNGYTFIKLNKILNQFDGIRINEYGCIVNMLYKNDLLVNHGDINDIVAIKTNEKLIGKVYKTLDYELEKQINAYKDIKLPINVYLTIEPNKQIEVKINDYLYLSDIKASIAKNAPLNLETVNKQFSKLNETPFYLNSINLNSNNAFLTIKQINDLRRQVVDNYCEYKLNSFVRKPIYSEVNYIEPKYEENENLILYNDKINDKYDLNYVINKDSVYSKNENAIISEIGGLLKNYKEKIAYYTLNCCNSYCFEFFKKIGFNKIILSSELNDIDVKLLIDAYLKRNNVIIHPYCLSKGSRVLMYIKANPFDKYMKENINYYIRDFNNCYLLKKNHNITEIIELVDNHFIDKQTFTIK